MILHHKAHRHMCAPNAPLSAEHTRMLTEASAICTDVIAERGVRTITRGRELPEGFSRRQRRRGGGILFTVHRPNRETDHCFRPDASDQDNPGPKYEMRCKKLGAPGNVLDVHPSLRHLIGDRRVPVIFVEGIKKADAITSAARRAGVEVLVVAITGVWNWLSEGKPIPDMFDIPVEGRRVTVCFDSDLLRNPNVQDAAKRLAEHLEERGAEVWITYLHDQADGSKTGADDFFAAGGTFVQLRMLTRRYDPEDFIIVKLSRDERLKLTLEDLERRWWEFEWKGMGGYSARDVALKLIEAAKRHGKVVDGGVRVVQAQGPLAIEAKVSTRTLWKALDRLEEWGFLYRDNDGRKPDKAGAFVVRADVSHKGTGSGGQGDTTSPADSLYARDLHLRAELRCPRLRWSRPKYTPRRGVVRGTRRVRRGKIPEPRDAIKRLGKIRGAIIDVLEASGGMLELEDLYGRLHPDTSPEDRKRWRPRDLTRRKNPESGKGRDGPMVMLEDAGIVAVEGNCIALADNWLMRVEEQRQLGKEREAEELDRKRYRLKSWAFHHRGEDEADPHWTNTEADGSIEDLEPEEATYCVPEPEPEISSLAAAVRDYLDRSPHDACQPPGWIGVTLWANGLHPKLTTPAVEVRDAIDELGGEAYLRERLDAAREAVA